MRFLLKRFISLTACGMLISASASAQKAADERDVLSAAGAYLKDTQPLPLMLSSRQFCHREGCPEAADERIRELLNAFMSASGARFRRPNEVVRTCPSHGACKYSHVIVTLREPDISADSATLVVDLLDTATRSNSDFPPSVIVKPRSIRLTLVREPDGWQVIKDEIIRIS